MARNANYRVQVRRRREGKTDYQARKAMVVSGQPRLVARPSISNANAQIIVAKPIGDMTIAAANSRELVKKYGWKAATGNIPAAYLTGLLCGLKAKAAGIDEAILDIGMIIPTKGARVFAILQGVLDAGVEVPHGEDKIVAHRARGDHIANYAQELSEEDAEVYAAKFRKCIDNGLAPEKFAEHFSKTRAAIVASFKGAEVAPEPESAPAPKAKPKPAPKPAAKAAPKEASAKAEVKAAEEAPKASKAKAKEAESEEAPEAAKKAVKEKAPAEAKAKAEKEETAPAKEKAPAKKATKKGENTE
jgi:large subunit ribosomal protein L18